MNTRRFIVIHNPPTLVTLLGLFLSLSAIYFALHQKMNMALILLMYAGIADLFDGFVARRCELSELDRRFGVQIDSMVDVVSFVIAPMVMGYQMGMDTWWALLALIFYSYAGVMRLAVFNAEQKDDTPVTHYRGLPVTYMAFILPLTLLLFSHWAPSWMLSTVLFLLFAGVGVLFIYNTKIPKPRGMVYAVAPLVVLSATAVFLLDGTF